MPLRIPQDILDQMVVHARELDPYECCGLLAGKDGTVAHLYRITNTVAKDRQAMELFHEAKVKRLEEFPETVRAEEAYFMDTKETIQAVKDMRERDLELTVIYHSHTHSPAYPSATDVGLAYYPDAAYVIVSLEDKTKPDIRAYWIKDRQVTPLEFRPI